LPFATRELSPCFFRRSFDTTGDTQRLPSPDCALDKLALYRPPSLDAVASIRAPIALYSH
jgi:hypothetical protein